MRHLFLFIVLLPLIGCGDQGADEGSESSQETSSVDKRANTNDSERMDVTENDDELVLDLKCDSSSGNGSTKSHLKAKAHSLKKLHFAYEVKRSGSKDFNDTKFYENLHWVKDTEQDGEGNDGRAPIRVQGLASFGNGVQEVNFAFVKAQKEMSENLYPRATIEEFIFHSEDCAENTERVIKRMKTNETRPDAWERMNKTPKAFFREGLRAYYITGGGWYMYEDGSFENLVNRLKS